MAVCHTIFKNELNGHCLMIGPSFTAGFYFTETLAA
jgi:hypothetical protein